jgi:hypothetical protein
VNRRLTALLITLGAVSVCLYSGCGTGKPGVSAGAVLEDSLIRLEVTPAGGLAVSLHRAEGLVPLAAGAEPAFLVVDTLGRRAPFTVKSVEQFVCESGDPLGEGRGLKLSLIREGEPLFSGVSLEARLCLYGSRPGVVVGRVSGSGFTSQVLSALRGTRFFALCARADLADPALNPYDFLLFQGAVYRWGESYTQIRLGPGYDAPNSTVRTGAKQPDGGGIPLDYLWTRRGGLALAHVDTVARVAALPVRVLGDGAVELAFEQPSEFLETDPRGAFSGVPVMVGAFGGDYYAPLRAYGSLLEGQGFRLAIAPPGSYQSIWCSWGFERKLVPGEILRTLPQVKSLGIPWVVVDDGWQSSIGDWPLFKSKFPRGDEDMRALVDSIHAAGMKAELWWVPMNVQENDPLYAAHPDWLVLDKEGKPKLEEYWKVLQLCPAVPGVVEQQRGLVRRFMKEWGYDGFKMDGGCQGMVSPCYNPAHHHSRPEESCEAVAALYRAIAEEAQAIKPGCVLEICECGIPPSPYKMAYCNQQVTADPVSSDQVRARIKMYRGLLGRGAAPFGDHVELATGPWRGPGEVIENGKDFASTLALGGVIGTKFTSLVDDTTGLDWEQHKGYRPWWEHWFRLYDSLRLYEGEYLNLYDIGWDIPETHVVARGDTLYYGIFAQGFSGRASLRGLTGGRRYVLTDYANDNQHLGEVDGGPDAALECKVDGSLLVRAAPLP